MLLGWSPATGVKSGRFVGNVAFDGEGVREGVLARGVVGGGENV